MVAAEWLLCYYQGDV